MAGSPRPLTFALAAAVVVAGSLGVLAPSRLFVHQFAAANDYALTSPQAAVRREEVEQGLGGALTPFRSCGYFTIWRGPE